MNWIEDLMEDDKTLEIVRSVEAKMDAERPNWRREWFERAAEELKSNQV